MALCYLWPQQNYFLTQTRIQKCCRRVCALKALQLLQETEHNVEVLRDNLCSEDIWYVLYDDDDDDDFLLSLTTLDLLQEHTAEPLLDSFCSEGIYFVL